MSQMSFVDEMKDKAGRLIPTAYTDIVTEATSDILLLPDMEKITFICDSANLKEENAVDVVRAVRRRIDNKNPKVQAFTVTLLDKLVKECGAIVHLEIAETKGLLRDLVNIAVKVPSRDGEREAKKSALTLILSMTIWFSAAAAANEKLKPLILLADDVRKRAGEKAVEGIEVETGVRLKRVAAPQQRAERNQESFQRAQQRELLIGQFLAAGFARIQVAIELLAAADQVRGRFGKVKAIPRTAPPLDHAMPLDVRVALALRAGPRWVHDVSGVAGGPVKTVLRADVHAQNFSKAILQRPRA